MNSLQADASAVDRPRILLLAYSCHPDSGSEPGAGWNRALQAARFYPTWLLCDEGRNRQAIERYLAANGPIPNLTFVFVPRSRFEDKLRRVPGMYYPAYHLWHRRAFEIAKKLHRNLRFDLVHQVNLCGFREPGYLWRLDVPFVWGPVGGAQNYPWRFLAGAGWRGALIETARSIANVCQMRFARRVGQAARRAKVMLAANETNAHALACRRGNLPKVELEIGVHPVANQRPRTFHHGGPLRILWSGVFEHRKALHLLLEAVAKLPADVPYELHILGRGPLEKRWHGIAKKLGVDAHCHWLGWLDHQQAIDEFGWADVFAFTSLRDTTGTVVLESLAAGTPILCLDHQGVHDIVTPDCGQKLPVANTKNVVRSIRDALAHWHYNRDELERLSLGAVQRADHYSWRRLGERMAAVYCEVLGVDEAVPQAKSSGSIDAKKRQITAMAGG
jgi:glycosyltransferase involved in cell wall biosynthesis